MRPLVYMDTARLGQMRPAAQVAQLDFVRLSAEEPTSLYFEEFLRDGFDAWPDEYQSRFPGLWTWPGVAGLKSAVRHLVQTHNGNEVLLSSRSLTLMELGASCLFRLCRRVLTTDLSWEPYQQLVLRAARQTANELVVIRAREQILRGGRTASDVADFVATQFLEQRCDGLFLPAVDHLGIRVPVREIVEWIHQRSALRFCLVDAAQAFCHIPLEECVQVADFMVFGSHKWLGAYLPMGIGLFGQPRTQEMVAHRLQRVSFAGQMTDPLLEFTEQLDGGKLNGQTETANVCPLMTCAGAIAQQNPVESVTTLSRQPIERISRLTSLPDWKPVQPHPTLRTRILLLDASSDSTSVSTAEAIRRKLLEVGIVATTYDDGLVRLSPPLRELATRICGAHPVMGTELEPAC